MVFVQVPELRAYRAGEEVAVLESVKAASNIGMPLDGRVVDVNATLETSPELVNKDALGAGWFFRLHPDDTDTMHHLLDQSAYERLINDQDHG